MPLLFRQPRVCRERCCELGLALQRGPDGGERGLLVLGIDVHFVGESGRRGDDSLDRREQVELLVGSPERDHAHLAPGGLVELLALEDDHLRTSLVEAAHEGRHVHLLAGGHDPHDAVAEIDLGVHDLLVVRQDLLVLRHPALDGRIRLVARGEMPGEVDAPGVVADVALDRLVHKTAEAGREVHAVAGVGRVEQLDRVVVGIRPDGRLQDRAGGLEIPGGLALRLDLEAVEGAEHLEPVLAAVLVDDGHDLVARLADAADEVGGHGLVAVVHREVHERHLLPGRPLRDVDLVDRERLRELQADVVRARADEAEQSGRGADAVDRTDRNNVADLHFLIFRCAY